MVTASYGHYGQRAARIRPDRICRIRLPASVSVLFFPKKAWAIVCKTDPDPIWRAWPGFGYTRIWSGLKAGWCAGIIWFGFWQDATGLLLVSHFQTRLHSSTDVLDNIQIQPGANLVLADCSSFGPNGSGPEISQCARIIRPASGPDANLIRYIYWVYQPLRLRPIKPRMSEHEKDKQVYPWIGKVSGWIWGRVQLKLKVRSK